MLNATRFHRSPAFWFWVLVGTHVAVWTSVPTITQANAPLDTIEMLYWGHEWQWGYYKHPPLPAWIAEFSSGLFGNAVWPTYLAAQLCIAACFWAVWRMARETLPSYVAICSAALLEACAYYNYTTPELNNNLLRRGTTALSVLFLYWAVTRKRAFYWIAAGGAIGLGLLSKYDHGVLVLCMLGFSVLHRDVRRLWKTPGPYLLIATATLVFLPHLAWMIENDFITLSYFAGRTAGSGTWLDHLKNPLSFAVAQAGAVALIPLFAIMMLGWRWRLRRVDRRQRLQRDYLVAVVLGPFALILCMSVLTGAYLRSMLGAPLWIFLPLLLLLAFEVVGREKHARRVCVVSATFGLALACALGLVNTFAASVRGRPLQVDFPGRALAQQVDRRWGARFDDPLQVVGGDWWEAGNVAFYCPSGRASVYPQLKPEWSPWTGDDDLTRQGGVILWKIRAGHEDFPRVWRTRFPRAIVESPIVIPCSKSAEATPLRVGLAIVPPAGAPQQKVATRPQKRGHH